MHQGRDQESLFIKQRKHRSIVHLITSVLSIIIVKNQVGVWLKFTLGKMLLFVLIPGIFNYFCHYTVLSIGPKDLKVGLLIKFGLL
jgi:hypothetical protein